MDTRLIMAQPKPGYSFIDASGKSYNVRKVHGKVTRLYADGTRQVKPAAKAAPAAPAATPTLSPERFAKWDPEHQRQALKFYGGNTSPEEFAGMTVSQKSQVLSRVRAGNKAATAPNSVEAPQTVNDINRAAEQAAAVKYGDAERGVKADIGTSPVQQQRITNWFDQYQQQLKDIGDQSQKAYGDAVTNATTLNDATSGAAAGDTAKRVAAAAADAASRGQTVDPTVQTQADQANANRRGIVDAIAAVIGGQKANDVAYTGQRKTIATNQAIQEHRKEDNTLGLLKDKLAGLLTDKGAYEGTTRQNLLSGERTNQLQQATLRSQILNTVTDAQTATDNRTQTAKDKAASRTAAAKTHYGPGSPQPNSFGFTYDEWSKLSAKDQKSYRDGTNKPKKPTAKAKPKTGPGSLTPVKESGIVTDINKLLGLMRTPPNWAGGPLKGKPMSADEVRHHYLANGADPRVVAVAISLFRNSGSLGPDGVKNAHDLGVHVNGRWKVIGAKKPAPAGTNYGNGAGAGSGTT